MQPNGRLYKMENDTIEITCTLANLSLYTIDDLRFDLPQPRDNEARKNEIESIRKKSEDKVRLIIKQKFSFENFENKT